jgi:predicted nucleotidyltransferase
MMTAPLIPAELVSSVVAYSNPRRVILFGSVARGDANEDSDLDLLVIVDDDTPAEKVTLKAGSGAVIGRLRHVSEIMGLIFLGAR